MTQSEFDEKWGKYIEPGFCGLAISDSKVIEYLDKEFEKEIKVNPDFMFSQIKLKFGTARVYANSDKFLEWEDGIDGILNPKTQ